MDNTAVPYAEKFKEFIRMCEEAKGRGIEVVAVAYPWYWEIPMRKSSKAFLFWLSRI